MKTVGQSSNQGNKAHIQAIIYQFDNLTTNKLMISKLGYVHVQLEASVVML